VGRSGMSLLAWAAIAIAVLVALVYVIGVGLRS
jgi:hypothetical protein